MRRFAFKKKKALREDAESLTFPKSGCITAACALTLPSAGVSDLHRIRYLLSSARFLRTFYKLPYAGRFVKALFSVFPISAAEAVPVP